MKGKRNEIAALVTFVLVFLLGAGRHAQAQDSGPLYERMAPIDQYLMTDRNTEIAFARTAAPESISRDAEVLVLGRHGYKLRSKARTAGCALSSDRGWPRSTIRSS